MAKFIEPSVTYWKQDHGIEGCWKKIADAARVCYQIKEKKEGETDKEYVFRTILKGLKEDYDYQDIDWSKIHGSVLEHGTVYLKVSFDSPEYEHYKNDKYSSVILKDGEVYVITNMRVVIENGYYADLKYWCEDWVQRANINNRYTFDIITDIGVSRELNRHRSHSITEMSTRYCNFSKKKFGSELTFIRPEWLTADQKNDVFIKACFAAENAYMLMTKDMKIPAEQARQVLPLSTKTELIHTASAADWEKFLYLRLEDQSGRCHPNMHKVAELISNQLYIAIPRMLRLLRV